MFDKYLAELNNLGATKIPNFFSSEACSDFLNKNKHIFNEKLSLNIPGNENNGYNLRIGNRFYGKKPTHWEVYKINFEAEKVSFFKNKLELLNLGEFKVCQFVMRKKFEVNTIPCHVDNLYNDKVTYSNCGIYLTDSSPDDAIFYIEGSHRIPTTEYLLDVSSKEKKYITANTGDLIIHNSYTWHGSENSDKEGRVTLYIKFAKE